MTELPWAAGTWTNPPAVVEMSGSAMTIHPSAGTDFWRPSADNPAHEDGHALLAPLRDGDVMQVLVTDFHFEAEFHQAGLYCRSPTQWAKAGVDVVDGAPALMSVVSAPWSDSAITHHAKASQYAIRVSLRSGTLTLRVGVAEKLTTGISWVTQRMIAWSAATIACGPFACAPDGHSQLRVTFADWSMPEPDHLLEP